MDVAMIRFVDEIGEPLQRAPWGAAPLVVGSVLTLDPSDLLWEVTAIRPSGPTQDVELRVTDDRTIYIDIDRSVATTPPMTTFLTTEDGVRLALHTLGGSGPPLIVCHATGFHTYAYAPMVRTLAASFSVYGIDFRCHGESESDGPRKRSWRDLVRDLRAAVTHIRADADAPTPIYAFGHSMGGAAILATQLADPGTFHSAFVYEPVVMPTALIPASPPGLPGHTRRRQESFRSLAEARDRFSTSGPFASFRSDALAAYVHHGLRRVEPERHHSLLGSPDAYRLRCAPEDEATFYEGSEPVLIDDLEDLELRLIVAAGEENDHGPARAASLVAERFGIDFVSFTGLGHLGPLENPDRVARSLIEELLPTTALPIGPDPQPGPAPTVST
jgi:pimeloyl-ACP methyl ester carboxylesterase